MAMVKFDCPQCGNPVEVNEKYRGKVVECNHCQKGIVIPRIKAKVDTHSASPHDGSRDYSLSTRNKTTASSLVRVKCPHCLSAYDVEKKDLRKNALCEDCGKLFIAIPEHKETASTLPDLRSVSGVHHEATSFTTAESSMKSNGEKGGKSPLGPVIRAPEVSLFSQTMRPDVEGNKILQSPNIDKGLSCPAPQANNLPISAKTQPIVWYVIGSVFGISLIAFICIIGFVGGMEKRNRMSYGYLEKTQLELDRKIGQIGGLSKSSIEEVVHSVLKSSEKSVASQDEVMQMNIEKSFADIRQEIVLLKDKILQLEKCGSSEVRTTLVQGRKTEGGYGTLQGKVDELSRRLGDLENRQNAQVLQRNPPNDPQKTKQLAENIPSAKEVESGLNRTVDREVTESKMSREELKLRYMANASEIKRLIEANPGCILVPSDKQARILETRFPTSQQQKYCRKDKITYVRELFRCTHCNSEFALKDANEACCSVSGKRSFALWRGKRLEAEETAKIYARIVELEEENEIIRKGGQPSVAKQESMKQANEKGYPETHASNDSGVSQNAENPSLVTAKRTVEELKRQYDRNVAEIKRLKAANPGCVIVPSYKQARILETRFASKGHSKYCLKDKITYVRDMFHCTNCNKDFAIDNRPGCCEVSRKRSYNEWSTRYREAEETEKINKRIDELLKENAELRKAAQ